MELTAELVEAGGFAAPVVATFPLSAIAHAHRAIDAGRLHGKAVLLVG